MEASGSNANNLPCMIDGKLTNVMVVSSDETVAFGALGAMTCKRSDLLFAIGLTEGDWKQLTRQQPEPQEESAIDPAMEDAGGGAAA